MSPKKGKGKKKGKCTGKAKNAQVKEETPVTVQSEADDSQTCLSECSENTKTKVSYEKSLRNESNISQKGKNVSASVISNAGCEGGVSGPSFTSQKSDVCPSSSARRGPDVPATVHTPTIEGIETDVYATDPSAFPVWTGDNDSAPFPAVSSAFYKDGVPATIPEGSTVWMGPNGPFIMPAVPNELHNAGVPDLATSTFMNLTGAPIVPNAWHRASAPTSNTTTYNASCKSGATAASTAVRPDFASVASSAVPNVWSKVGVPNAWLGASAPMTAPSISRAGHESEVRMSVSPASSAWPRPAASSASPRAGFPVASSAGHEGGVPVAVPSSSACPRLRIPAALSAWPGAYIPVASSVGREDGVPVAAPSSTAWPRLGIPAASSAWSRAGIPVASSTRREAGVPAVPSTSAWPRLRIPTSSSAWPGAYIPVTSSVCPGTNVSVAVPPVIGAGIPAEASKGYLPGNLINQIGDLKIQDSKDDERRKHYKGNASGTHSNDLPTLSESSRVEQKSKATPSNQSVEGKKACRKVLPIEPVAPLNFSSQTLVPFPGPGIHGRRINLIANYFDLKSKLPQIFHYDVSIEVKSRSGSSPVKSPGSSNSDSRIGKQQEANVCRKLCQKVFEEFVAFLKKSGKMKKFDPIYDGGKNLFTAMKLPITEKRTYTIPLKTENGKTTEYLISLQPVKKLDGTNIINMHALQNWTSYSLETMNEVLLVLNAIMSHRRTDSQEIRVGKSFFSLTQANKQHVGDGLEIWRGYNQSVHLTKKGPAVVLNLSARVFHKSGPAIDYISEILHRNIRTSSQPLTADEIKRVVNVMKGINVRATHLNYKRIYHIKGITEKAAKNIVLEMDNGKVTVAEYFHKKYKTLQYPHLNCFHMRCRNDKTFIPIENCYVVDCQPKLGREDLNKSVTTEMIRSTAITPSERFQRIGGYAREVQNRNALELGQFQLFMDMTPKKVTGRVLKAPELKYLDGSISSPRNGTWGINGKFVKSLKNTSWILMSFAGSLPNLNQFAVDLEKSSKSHGLCLGKFLGIRVCERNESTASALMSMEVEKPSFAVIVLSKKYSYHDYDEIKFILDYRLGIINQCVLDNVINKNDPRIISNMCLKINTKLGGINHQLAETTKILRSPAIIFGADVVHSTLCPSIAAVVGSLDCYPSSYQVSCRVQENQKKGKISQELIIELEDMVKIILKAFLRKNEGRVPERFIFFRDGVSEGQFEAVRNHEVTAIQNASMDVLGTFVPTTFIVVQKRHQTRLRPEDPKDGVGRGMNVPAGTTVDTDITYPNAFDYFLCSHEGIRGTSKPSRYTVLYDGNELNSDELQELCYHMCHMFVRCTKSVSIPAPVKYADLAAYRAKKYADFHLRKVMKANNNSLSSDTGSQLPEFVREAIKNMELSKSQMFFI